MLLLARVVMLSAVVHPLAHRAGVARTARLVRPRTDGRIQHGRSWLDSRRVRTLVEFADPFTSKWTEGLCLERSLMLYRLLNQEGVPVDLVIGLRADEGAVDGHAWLELEGRPVLESVDPTADFRRTLRFASPFEDSDLPFPQVISQPL